MMKPAAYAEALENAELAEELLTTHYQHIHHVRTQNQQKRKQIDLSYADKRPRVAPTVVVFLPAPPSPGNTSNPA